ncbi:hypothetical protein H1R20_g12301, partial [Candolleomyces eurysporus]
MSEDSSVDFEKLGRVFGRSLYSNYVLTMVGVALAAIVGSIEMAWIFDAVFEATSGEDILVVMGRDWLSWSRLAANIASELIVLLGDGLLIYRCYVICVGCRWLAVLPALTYLSSFAFFIAAMVNEHQNSRTVANRCTKAWITLVAVTNIIVTIVIGSYLIRARRTLSKALPMRDMRVYTGVAAILTESALPLAFFGIVAVVMNLAAPNMHNLGALVVGTTCEGIFWSFTGIAPHMIIFRVTTGRSWLKFPIVKDGAVSNPIKFAHQTAESSFFVSSRHHQFGRNLDEAEEQRDQDSDTDGSSPSRESKGQAKGLEKV